MTVRTKINFSFFMSALWHPTDSQYPLVEGQTSCAELSRDDKQDDAELSQTHSGGFKCLNGVGRGVG